MEFLTVLNFAIFYASGWLVYRVYKKLDYKHKFRFRKHDLILYTLYLYLFVLPIFLLLKNFSFEELLTRHLAGLVFGGIIAEYLMSQHLDKLSWGLIILFTIIGLSSILLLPPFRYKDGKYCANVHYSNPDSGTESDYRLEIKIEEAKIIKIIFPKGGWLDEDHFDPEPIDINGEVTITDDRDYEYTISHLKKGECE